MTSKHLHIISFNVPYPADYGGVIDVFYRIKALYEAGVKIHLHCFQYGRHDAEILNQYCETVDYYPRSLSLFNQFSITPFIVKTRSNNLLLENLVKDDYPILFEGLHCCFFLNQKLLAERKKIVRCHNIEHNYYHSLASKSSSFKKYFYFKIEALRLNGYESILKKANYIAAISAADANYFQNRYGNTFQMLPCHPSSEVSIQMGRGDYLLYHGDLSTQENVKSVSFIVREIALHSHFNFIVAGKNPTIKLINEVSQFKNVTLIANPAHSEMQKLISNAHINLLPTFQATGFKLKLLNALYNGRFCLVTPQMVEGTGLSDACELAIDGNGFCLKIEDLFQKEFTEVELQKRTALLDRFSNNAAISYLLEII